MPQIDLWLYWVGAGIILMIAEIFTPGFVLALIGAAAIVTGFFAWVGVNSYIQLLIFAVCNIVLFSFVRKILYRTFFDDEKGPKTNYLALEGRSGKVTVKVADGEHGEVKIGGEIWYAVPEDDEKVFETGTGIIVSRVEGNKLFVKEEK
jgi:membrane protein implicated in regulation of membrane protease activity